MHFDSLIIESFLAVAEAKSFTKAAKKLYRTQSAISQQIKKLEEILGKKLFVRNAKLNLTQEGEVFLEYAKKGQQLHKDLLLKLNKTTLSGDIRFGLPEDFATLFLADVLTDFTKKHPNIILHIECDLTLNLLDRFKRNEFDLVLVKMCKPQDFPFGQEIYSEKLVWVGDVDVKHYIENKIPLPLVLSPNPCVYRSRVIKALEDNNIKWELVFSSPSYNSTIAAVKAGLGVSILPRIMLPNGLKTIENNNMPILEDTHISFLKNTESSDALNSFEDFVLQKINSRGARKVDLIS